MGICECAGAWRACAVRPEIVGTTRAARMPRIRRTSSSAMSVKPLAFLRCEFGFARSDSAFFCSFIINKSDRWLLFDIVLQGEDGDDHADKDRSDETGDEE